MECSLIDYVRPECRGLLPLGRFWRDPSSPSYRDLLGPQLNLSVKQIVSPETDTEGYLCLIILSLLISIQSRPNRRGNASGRFRQSPETRYGIKIDLITVGLE